MSDWIWDTLLVTSLLIVAVLIVRRPVAQIFGATVAYWLWLLPAARLFMPTLTREVEVAPAAPVATSSSPEVAAPAIGAAIDAAGAAPMAADSGLASIFASIDWMQIAMILWLGIAALIFMVQTMRYVSLRDALLADATELGTRDGVSLVETDQVGGPLAFGLFKRYIAVPLDFNSVFEAEEREMALAHEMAHHRSGDLFANLAAFTVLCLTWFSPFSWMAWHAFRFDQEAACDARVLDGCDANEKQVYGRTLARAAHDGVPTFAMALNSPKTLIARLRNLTMDDISKNRRLFGKMGVFAAIGAALPLSATVVTVPVEAHDMTVIVEEHDDKKKGKTRKTRTKIVTHGTFVNEAGDSDTAFVKTIKKDGKTIVLRTNKELSEAEVEKMVEEAEAGRLEADKAMEAAEEVRIEGEKIRIKVREIEKEAEKVRAKAMKDAEKSIALSHKFKFKQFGRDGKHMHVRVNGKDMDIEKMIVHIDGEKIAKMIPQINIEEVTRNCRKGHPVRTRVAHSQHGENMKVHVSVCGKGMAKEARQQALESLKEARDDVKESDQLKKTDRKKVLKTLDREIKRLEKVMSTAWTPMPPRAPKAPHALPWAPRAPQPESVTG